MMRPPLSCDIASGYVCPDANQEISERTPAELGRGQAPMVLFLLVVLHRGTRYKFFFSADSDNPRKVRGEVIGSRAVWIRVSRVLLKRADVRKHVFRKDGHLDIPC